MFTSGKHSEYLYADKLFLLKRQILFEAFQDTTSKQLSKNHMLTTLHLCKWKYLIVNLGIIPDKSNIFFSMLSQQERVSQSTEEGCNTGLPIW